MNTKASRPPHQKPHRSTLRGRTCRIAAAVLAAALVLSACGSGGETSQNGELLNLGSRYKPNSLDPAKINGAMNWFVNLAYDPLIYDAPDGTLKPRLATSWKYVGGGNTTVELKLRPRVKFSDGSALTATVVKNNIDYYRKAGGEAAGSLNTVKTVTAVDSLTVRVTVAEPNPLLPSLFTQRYLAGHMISGQALKQPGKLATTTHGAGPYILDESRTVPNDHYTYTPNPGYWDKADAHYRKVVIKVLPNANTALAALKTGQIDVMEGEQPTANAARSGGLKVTATPQVLVGLTLADRTGKLAPALGDVRVRRALNHAVNRDKITKALYGSYGKPTEQIVLPGRDGYNDRQYYSYDPKKAKKLLADAGYADGFTLPAVTSGGNLMIQAIAEDLKKIGVRLKLTSHSDPVNYLRDMATGKFPAYAGGFGTGPVYLMGPRLFLPEAAQFNPLKSSDTKIASLYRQAAAADATTRATLDQQIVARLTEQAWFVPVSFTPLLYYSRSTVTGIQASPARPSIYPAEFRPAN